MRRTILSLSTTLLIGGALSTFAATNAGAVTAQSQIAAQAEGFANSATFNAGIGMGPQQQNLATSGVNRDANGNILIANGILSGSGAADQQTGAGSANTTAIGNNFNDSSTNSSNHSSSKTRHKASSNSQQTSTGNQDANTLNGNLDF